MDDCYFITMEYVDGLDMSALLKGAAKEQERIPVDVALYIINGVLRGLKHAHEATDDEGHPLGIVHRDVSPQNVLLSVNGDIKLSDLGAATANEAYRSTRTQKHFRLGKVLYMAPEQRRRKSVDARADIYSTGILLAEMLLGQDEFHQDANMFLAGMCALWEKVAERLASPLGQELAQVVERALFEDPQKRFQTADEMLSALEALLVEYAPGTSVDRVARLVHRLQKRRQTRKSDGEDESDSKRSISSVVSLHTGDVQPLREPSDSELPDLQFPGDSASAPAPGDGLEEVVTTIARPRKKRSETPTDIDAPDENESGNFDFENEATLIHKGVVRPAPTPLPQDVQGTQDSRNAENIGPAPPSAADPQLEPDQPALPSVLVEDKELLDEPPTRKDAPAGVTYEVSRSKVGAPEQQSSRKPLLVAALIIVLVLIAGLVFGGILADNLFPMAGDGNGSGAQVEPSPNDLISATPNSDQSTPETPAPTPTPPPPSPPDVPPAVPQQTATPPSIEPDAPAPSPAPASTVPELENGRDRDRDRSRDRDRNRDRVASQESSGQQESGPSRSAEPSFLNINSRPYGIPHVDGVPIPSGTPVARYRVTPGTHRVMVRFPSTNSTAERVVRVEPGQTKGVTLTLGE